MDVRQKWDQRYGDTDYEPSSEPSPFLTEATATLTPGTALCLAAGDGRNAVWLARASWSVTAVDISAKGLEWCQRYAREEGVTINTIEADLASFDLGHQQWDLITMIIFNDPALFPSVRQSLRPGGHFLFHTFSVGQRRQKWGPSNAAFLARRQDLEDGFGDWPWPRFGDDDYARSDGRIESSLRLLATNPPNTNPADTDRPSSN